MIDRAGAQMEADHHGADRLSDVVSSLSDDEWRRLLLMLLDGKN